MPEPRSETPFRPTKLKVGSIHADSRQLEDPVHVLIGNGQKITIAPGTPVLRIDFMPGGKRNPPRTREIVETNRGPRELDRVNIAEAMRRMRELAFDMPKFAQVLQRDSSLRTLGWVVGEANGPMARVALKRMGFIPATTTEPRSPEEYEEKRKIGSRSVTMAIPMEEFLKVEEKLDEVTRVLQKRKDDVQKRLEA